MNPDLVVIGGGLAGSEAAWQAAQRGLRVSLHEMRPNRPTGAHATDRLAELVCSNSLGSNLPDRASGVLKTELRSMGSFLLACAEETAVPAGGALAVDREAFAELVTARVEGHPRIELVRSEVERLPAGPAIVASGPLTAPALAAELQQWLGGPHLYFYDALAPIVEYESVDLAIAFRASRYGRGEVLDGDYWNCPLTRAEYDNFVAELVKAERIALREFEADIASGVRAGPDKFFESCLPVEIIAERGLESLAYGPMRAVGLRDPHTGRRPYAVVQLRQDNLAGSLYNLVGFQTNLTFSEQQRVLRLIPGLGRARFARYGMLHRNTFINSPRTLLPTLQAQQRADIFFAGQITGVEGYMGNVATGLLAGINAARLLAGEELLTLPATTMLGALCWYVTHADPDNFQPMKANFGLLPALERAANGRDGGKRERFGAYAARSADDLSAYLAAAKFEAVDDGGCSHRATVALLHAAAPAAVRAPGF